MKINALFLVCLIGLPAAAQSQTAATERLGPVSFAVSCAAPQRAAFDRGIALLHDFWYVEARRQFEQVAKADPACAMAHWGIAMSVFHQIWDRPSEASVNLGWHQMQAAKLKPAKSAREREYIAALSRFYEPDQREYQSRIDDYAADMGALYRHYPKDVDAGAFYALALLAATAPDDTGLNQAYKALAVLKPLILKYPDHPGLVHYVIHACDSPSLAQDGLAAAEHYGEIAASAPHAVHMPSHIFSRLGMWQADIDANLASVAASHAAEARGQSGAMDQFHSDDFLVYAYLQTGQDAEAENVLEEAAAALKHLESMPQMSEHMAGMSPYYQTKLPIFFDLEMRDWKKAAALEPVSGASPQIQVLTFWAHAVAAGHERQAQQASASLAQYDVLMQSVKQGREAFIADSTGTRIERGEMLAWVAFAQGNAADAVKYMKESAELQDLVGQGEVDIPAREMLGDILLEAGEPQRALIEYQRALKLSPNRFNGLLNAGLAAEAAGDASQAQAYFAALLKSTDGGAHSSRPEFDHVKSVMSSAKLAVQ
jgi:tetratricopeptide (TPR) repeat protein